MSLTTSQPSPVRWKSPYILPTEVRLTKQSPTLTVDAQYVLLLPSPSPFPSCLSPGHQELQEGLMNILERFKAVVCLGTRHPLCFFHLDACLSWLSKSGLDSECIHTDNKMFSFISARPLLCCIYHAVIRSSINGNRSRILYLV